MKMKTVCRFVLKTATVVLITGLAFHFSDFVKTGEEEYKVMKESKEMAEELQTQVLISEDESHLDIGFSVDFDALLDINPDIFGWLYVPDTYLSFPVLKERTVLEYYYLDHDYTGASQKAGAIFTPAQPQGIKDAHLLLFGHHTRYDGVAFSNLFDLYGIKDNGMKYQTAYLLYRDRIEEYELWTAVESDAEDPVYEIPYQTGTNAYAGLLTGIEAKGSYIIGETPDKDDKTLVLSTCNGRAGGTQRFYVVFRLKGVMEI